MPEPPVRPGVPAEGAVSGSPPANDPPRVTAPRAEAIICGDPRLIGRRRANIVGGLPGCGIFEPVQVTKIAGIRIQGELTLGCPTARTFANWLTGVAAPEARKTLGARIDTLVIYGSYSCRTRNNRPGARLSEHAVGRAVDVAAFILGNGRKVSVLDNWGKGTRGAFLHTVWEKACGPFKTVLGPEADRFHRDHFHFDTAQRRSTYCR